MKKFGFTLAEVLLTLSIVGVLAAVTIPGVVSSSSNDANAARLAVTVSNIENAMHSMIATEGASNLYGTSAWGVAQNAGKALGHSEAGKDFDSANIPAFVGYLGQYLAINGFQKKASGYIYEDNGGIKKLPSSSDYKEGDKVFPPGFGACFPIELKNGALMHVRIYPKGDGEAKDKQKIIENGGSLYSSAADVFIDVNGKQKPNTVGRDIFNFALGSDGVLYPAGSIDVSVHDNYSSTETWDNESAATFACTDTKKVNSGWGCTARLISNGYKFDY